MSTNNLNTYNPFGKSLSEIQPSDLEALKSVHEGWYIDYKADALKARAYAKAISAMANTYGGWIFFGVEEASRDNNVAGSFPGIAADQIDKVSQGIRQAAAEHLNPLPFFECKAVEIPGAQSGEKVICVYVPKSPKAPIIHSDGRIYRRINDSSEPVPENNREVVEHLFQRSKKVEEWYEDWFETDPELSEAESEVAYLRVLLTPDYWAEESLWYRGSTEDFRRTLQKPTEGISFSVPYEHFYTKSEGFVCRSLSSTDARQIASTLIVHRDLQSEIWVPIPSFSVGSYSDYQYQNEELDDLVLHLSEKGFHSAKVLDLTQSFGSVDGFFTLQQKFQKELGYSGNSYVKFKLMNVWRHVPVISAPLAELRWDEFGVPMVLTESVSSAKSGGIGTFIEVNLHKETGTENKEFLLSSGVFSRLLMDVGMGAGSTDEFSKLVSKAILASFERAKKNEV